MTLRRTRIAESIDSLSTAFLIAAFSAHLCADAVKPLAHTHRRSKHAKARALRAIARRKRRHA